MEKNSNTILSELMENIIIKEGGSLKGLVLCEEFIYD